MVPGSNRCPGRGRAQIRLQYEAKVKIAGTKYLYKMRRFC